MLRVLILLVCLWMMFGTANILSMLFFAMKELDDLVCETAEHFNSSKITATIIVYFMLIIHGPIILVGSLMTYFRRKK